MDKYFDLIRLERFRQVEKWGDIHHDPIEYIALLAEEVGEVSRHAHELHWNGKHYDVNEEESTKKMKEEIIQVSALCIAFLESLDDG